jgi:protocatechuate 3,4-dioxygenase beta subunit
MKNMTEEELTQTVLDEYGRTPDDRTREIILSLVRHLHAFIRDVKLTEPEWMTGIEYITRAGQISTAKRQEVILFSDLLGISALVNMVSANVPNGATETTVIGPFFVENAPKRERGESIALQDMGYPLIIRGKVLDIDGVPVPRARIDVWQNNANALYDVQDSAAPENNLRGYYLADEDGSYIIRTIRPTQYPIPTDGPAGILVKVALRHPMRPAHVHAMISAEGYQTLTTHIFDGEDCYIDSDVVFAVKESLILDIKLNESQEDADLYGMKAPFHEVLKDLILVRKAANAA